MIALIDGDIIVYTVIFRKKQDSHLGEMTFEEIKENLPKYLYSLFEMTSCNCYLGFLGGKNNFRYNIYPDYKSGRKEKPKWYNETRELLINEYSFKIIDGFETDDAIASYSSKILDSIIISNDHDFDQLEGYKFNPRSQTKKYTSKEEADFNFWKSMLTGCKTDKIRGIYGIGEVKAAQILKDRENLEEAVKEVYKASYPDTPVEYPFNFEDIWWEATFNINYALLKLKTDLEIIYEPVNLEIFSKIISL